MKAIVQKDHDVLRKHAKDVPISDIPSKKIQVILDDMREALRSQSDGVAIAAPQISHSLRIFIISEEMFSSPDEITGTKKPGHFVFINPVITKLSKQKKWLEEGCLSVRYLYGFVERSVKATISAYNEKGEKFTLGASGLLAQIFQHEVDHLNGTLFIDKAKDLQEIPPEPHNHEPENK